MAGRGRIGQDVRPCPSPAEASRLIVVGAGDRAAAGEAGEAQREVVEQPAKVMRIGSMIKQLLDEVRAVAARRDRPGRGWREIYETSVASWPRACRPTCATSSTGCRCPSTTSVPSEAELRVAQAQLVGWLEGLFHGIQATLFAQQMAAQSQLEQMRRRGLPAGSAEPGGRPSAAPTSEPAYPPTAAVRLRTRSNHSRV